MPPFPPWLHEPIPTKPEVDRTVGTYSTYSFTYLHSASSSALSSFPSSSPDSETEAITCEIFNLQLRCEEKHIDSRHCLE